MRAWGAIVIFVGGFMTTWPASHAIGMYQTTGDDRWFLTIIGAPIMGLTLIAVGMMLRRVST